MFKNSSKSSHQIAEGSFDDFLGGHMKILKTLPIVMFLTSACGTSESFNAGKQSAGAPSTSKKKGSTSADVAQAEPEMEDSRVTQKSTENDTVTPSEKVTAEIPEKAPPQKNLTFADQVGPAIQASLTAGVAGNPNVLSAADSAQLTASLTAVAQGAALGKGAAANAATIKAVLALVGKLANVKLGALPAAGAANAAALAGVAAAAQKLAAAGAALDLAGVQAAIADIVKAIMDLIA
jgi:hypothetical protein